MPESACPMERAYLGLGSNIEPEAKVREALFCLARQVVITGLSTFYVTPAIGRPEQPDYLNGVVRIETDLGPNDLKFRVLRPIETALGRVRSADKFAPRPIDLDILLFGDQVVDSADLAIPDPDLRRRPFLAMGVLELEPAIELPDSGESLSSVLDRMVLPPLKAAADFTQSLRERLGL